ncbi:hypothetical protein Ciccas_007223 [Cichlidogyrus casuarinus]|uniref:Uncharacterized protein n=1 Tax=Cichlidogyrus casuarinus TaxID=1844966 RepID=A0ABD2Q3H2_9PLAT
MPSSLAIWNTSIAVKWCEKKDEEKCKAVVLEQPTDQVFITKVQDIEIKLVMGIKDKIRKFGDTTLVYKNCGLRNDRIKKPDSIFVTIPESLAGFVASVKRMRSSDFEEIFQSLKAQKKLFPQPSTVANLQENADKNRYAAVVPFVRYIATQGPKNDTIADFWCMVLENEASSIIMLTEFVHEYSLILFQRLVEDGSEKSAVYWPSEEARHLRVNLGVNGEEIDIELVESVNMECMVARNIRIVSNCRAERNIDHFHFRNWSQHKSPSMSQMLQFLSVVQNETKLNNSEQLLVVHCGSGAGRSGTFMVLDTIVRKLQVKEQSVDLIGEILQLRKFRTGQVGSVSQLKFLYRIIAMYIEKELSQH